MAEVLLLVEIPGAPVAWQRSRQNGRGRRVRFFEAPHVAAWRRRIRAGLVTAMRGREMFTGPLSMSVTAIHPPLSGDRRVRRPSPFKWKATRPDVDNLAKIVMDAAQGIVFADDAQVCELIARKVHERQDGPPGVLVVVRTPGTLLP